MNKRILGALLLLGPIALVADEITMKPLVGNVDWTDAANFEGGVAPQKNDTVIIPKKWITNQGWPAVSNSVNDASFSLISSLAKVKVEQSASLVITVPSGSSAELPVSVSGAGNLVKAGFGEL